MRIPDLKVRFIQESEWDGGELLQDERILCFKHAIEAVSKGGRIKADAVEDLIDSCPTIHCQVCGRTI